MFLLSKYGKHNKIERIRKLCRDSLVLRQLKTRVHIHTHACMMLQPSLETSPGWDEWIIGCLGTSLRWTSEAETCWSLVVGVTMLPLGYQGVKLGHSFWSRWSFKHLCGLGSGLGTLSGGDGFHTDTSKSHRTFFKRLNTKSPHLVSVSSCFIGENNCPS